MGARKPKRLSTRRLLAKCTFRALLGQITRARVQTYATSTQQSDGPVPRVDWYSSDNQRTVAGHDNEAGGAGPMGGSASAPVSFRCD